MRALAAVVAIHVVGLGSFLMVQGCATNNSQSGWEDLNTMPKKVEAPPAPRMPPAAVRPAPVKKPMPYVAPKPDLPPAVGTYKVSKGDTLSAVAARYGISWKTLAAMNGIDDPKKLRVGQTLSVPASAAKVPATVKKPAPVKKALPSGGTYTIQSGDTLSGIASRNKVKVADLKAANGLKGDRIIVGQKLVIPGVAAPVQRKAAAPAPAEPKAPTPAPAPVPAAPIAAAPAMVDAPVETAPAPAEAAPAASLRVKAIIVYSGDTLDSIAAQYYTTVEKLNELNKFSGPVQLRPGQRIYVPISE